MPKRTAKPSAREAPGSDGRSDDQLYAERKRKEAFEAADSFLRFVGWLLWFLAGAWFLIFADRAPAISSFHKGASEGTLCLLVCGSMCGAFSRASPRGTWSAWRKFWQLGLSAGFASLALAFASLIGATAPGQSFSTPLVVAFINGLTAAGAIFTYPGDSPSVPKGSNAICGRLLLVADGLLSIALASSIIVASTWSDASGRLAIAAAVVPLLLGAVPMLMSRTDAELNAAVPPAILFDIVATARSLGLGNFVEAASTGILAVFHVMLYLPLPLQDPDSNPFYTKLSKMLRQFSRFMSQPVSGFGEDGD